MSKQNIQKRKSNVSSLKEQLTAGETSTRWRFIFNGPLTISEFSLKINKNPTEILTYYFKKE